MTTYEIARWYALIDAVNVIGEKCDDCGTDFESVELKPLEILKYVEYASDNIYSKLLNGNDLW
jgi:hypothetical protein